jgi:DNA-binding response OmpR family regulator
MERARKIVVIADDEETVVLALQALLCETYTVYPAVNGTEAVEITKNVKPDLVLMDVVMPVMDGIEACRRIKSNRETSQIPVLMISAKCQLEDTLKGFNSGADSYMVKPFMTGMLLAKIKELIIKSEIKRELN